MRPLHALAIEDELAGVPQRAAAAVEWGISMHALSRTAQDLNARVPDFLPPHQSIARGSGRSFSLCHDCRSGGAQLQFAAHQLCAGPCVGSSNREISKISKLSGPTRTGEHGIVSTQEDAALEREFDVLMAKAGAKVPTDRKAGIVAGYKDIKRMTLLLRQPRTEAGEPSNIYSLIGFARSKRP
jgi:hypothetical protein